MSMNHDLTTRLARGHQRQMLAEAGHQQRHQPRRPAPQTPRTATRIIRGLAAAIASARLVAAQAGGHGGQKILTRCRIGPPPFVEKMEGARRGPPH
jgi:hypothetical protein